MCGILRFCAEFSVFCAPFRFFRSKMEKTQKSVFEQKVPLTKRLYINVLTWTDHFSTFGLTFSLFAILGDKSDPERKKSVFCVFLVQKQEKSVLSVLGRKYLPEPLRL